MKTVRGFSGCAWVEQLSPLRKVYTLLNRNFLIRLIKILKIGECYAVVNTWTKRYMYHLLLYVELNSYKISCRTRICLKKWHLNFKMVLITDPQVQIYFLFGQWVWMSFWAACTLSGVDRHLNKYENLIFSLWHAWGDRFWLRTSWMREGTWNHNIISKLWVFESCLNVVRLFMKKHICVHKQN